MACNMPVKYIPYTPDPIRGQSLLSSISRSQRLLRYRDHDKVFEKIQRGMPYYEVETVEHAGKPGTDWNNLLLRGECLCACAYLKEQGIKVDLVYIDPPFASGANYAKKVYLRRNPHFAEKIAQAEQELEIEELQAFEETMYGDIWQKEDYLNWMYENLVAIKSVMSDTASIYVHLDWHIGHYVKVLMDEVFGEGNFANEIIWFYRRWSASSSYFQNMHDTILFYSKNSSSKLNPVYVEATEGQKKKHNKGWDRNSVLIDGRMQPQLLVYNQAKVDEAVEKGRINLDEYARIVHVDTGETIAPDVWEINYINSQSRERLGYPTQKPKDLLERIIKASSDEGMIVADFFGGSGVTAKVANDLNRKFIHCDVGINSLQITRDRLQETNAEFQVLDIKDGVSLFRNPQQTMDKLAKLMDGLQQNVEGLSDFWFGAIQDSKLGSIPVYVPNLVDSSEKVLDIPVVNRIFNEELQKLEDMPEKAIACYVDIEDHKELEQFIEENNPLLTKIELRDLKPLLDHVVSNDKCHVRVEQAGNEFITRIHRFHSDRLQQKLDEYNAKRRLNAAHKEAITPVMISDEGLELIEWLAVDCENAEGAWHSSNEIKIDKLGYTTIDGRETKEFWNGAISSKQKPLRIKIRNIAGDETIKTIDD